MSLEQNVKERYAAGAAQKEDALCCPVTYDPQYLKLIPEEILEKDYGCGDPSQYLKEGDHVLDLGSGGGKICYIASQVVGASGSVIGVDFNPAMLNLALKYKASIAQDIGYSNVEFRRGKIQDLKTSLDLANEYLIKNPIKSAEDLVEFESKVAEWNEQKPLIASDSIDVIVSNCVLNLVRSEDKKQLFEEMFRVVKKGGRVAISDIVSDEIVPQHLQDDSDLWSGCISGAYQEKEFIQAFEDAGFYGAQIVKRDEKPWQVVEGIEFRSVTVVAYKGKQGPCLDRNQAVIYQGPWKQVWDDDGHVIKRGERYAVCEKTFNIYTNKPYKQDIIAVPPYTEVPLSEAPDFDCKGGTERPTKVTKGKDYKVTTEENANSSCC